MAINIKIEIQVKDSDGKIHTFYDIPFEIMSKGIIKVDGEHCEKLAKSVDENIKEWNIIISY